MDQLFHINRSIQTSSPWAQQLYEARFNTSCCSEDHNVVMALLSTCPTMVNHAMSDDSQLPELSFNRLIEKEVNLQQTGIYPSSRDC